jgi:serine/threonine-protein kinase
MTTRFPSTGEEFGEFAVLERLGMGGMGVVFAAQHRRMNRRVALKVLRPELADDEEYRDRFGREVRLLAGLDSPHVIQIYDHGEIDGCLYLATQLVPGGDLGRWLDSRGALPVVEAVRITEQVTEALADAHEIGVLHRDVKPSNVLIRGSSGDRRFAYLCDFGIAREQESDRSQTTGLLGTSGYLAPERYLGRPASCASDLYSLGCLLWAALTGSPPYQGTGWEVAQAHIAAPIPWWDAEPPNTDINDILQRAMAKKPEDRFGTTTEMFQALRGVGDRLSGQSGWGSTRTNAKSPVSSPSQEPKKERSEGDKPRPDSAKAAPLQPWQRQRSNMSPQPLSMRSPQRSEDAAQRSSESLRPQEERLVSRASVQRTKQPPGLDETRLRRAKVEVVPQPWQLNRSVMSPSLTRRGRRSGPVGRHTVPRRITIRPRETGVRRREPNGR